MAQHTGYLLDAKFQEIAQWLQTKVGTPGALNGTVYGNKKVLDKWAAAAKQVGLLTQIDVTVKDFKKIVAGQALKGIALASAQQLTDIGGLLQAVKAGVVTAQEASAYLSTKYPGTNWSGGVWGDQGAAAAAVKAVDASQAAEDSPDFTPPEEVAQIAQSNQAAGASQGSGSTPATSSLLSGIGELPSNYDPLVIQDEIDQFTQKVSFALLDVQQGNIAFKANTIPGGALVPGTVQPQKLDPLAMREYLSQSPGPNLAVKIAHTRSSTIDRWVKGSAYEGPGRVLRTNRVTYPQGLIPSPGPARFRIITPGMQFGVMSIMHVDGSGSVSGSPDMTARYGVVLANIPHLLGRVPQQIVGVWEGEAPVALAAIEGNVGGYSAVPPLFHTKATSLYDTTAPFPFVTAYNESGNSTLTPNRDADYGLCRGFDVSLITGVTGDEVYRQLNTRQSRMGVALGETAHGPSTTIPPLQHLEPTGNKSTEETLSSPAPASVVRWNGSTSTGVKYAGLTESSSLDVEDKLVQGVPFAYDDCRRLVATDTEFSVVIQPRFQKQITPAGGATWSTPDRWWQVGVQTVGPSGRTWAVDIIIE